MSRISLGAHSSVDSQGGTSKWDIPHSKDKQRTGSVLWVQTRVDLKAVPNKRLIRPTKEWGQAGEGMVYARYSCGSLQEA